MKMGMKQRGSWLAGWLETVDDKVEDVFKLYEISKS